jgi:hypothetical protein
VAVEKVEGGFRWGKTGKIYKRRINAVKAGEKKTSKKSSTGHSTGGVVKSGLAKGGSTVNAAGNYTKPTMRKNLVASVKAGSKGGKPGQWSARKAQMVAKQYKAKGGGYKS